MPSASYTIKRCLFPGYKIAKKCHKLIVACSPASVTLSYGNTSDEQEAQASKGTVLPQIH